MTQTSSGAQTLCVQVCGRLVTIPPEASQSLSLLSRHLAQQLKISGHACLQLADIAGNRINSDQDLVNACQQGKHPLQASMTAAALREIEQKKSEVETKKEELAQFQWQVVVDQIAQLAKQVATLTAQLQGVKDTCTQKCQTVQQEEALARERMEEAVARETQQREVGLKDVESKIDKLVQAICSERSARDVAVHQLGAQIQQVVSGVEGDRSLHEQERAEVQRMLSSMKHQVDAETARNEEQWTWHLESAKRMDARLEEKNSSDVATQLKVNELESAVECLKASTSSLESAQAAHGRTVQEMMTRRGDELSKAVRDEMLGRENHISRFAKELETSWQSLEARLQRNRDEATNAVAAVTERVRVVENRCTEVEKDLGNHVRMQSERDQTFTEKLNTCLKCTDELEMSLKSSDVVTHTTVSRVEDIMQRLVNAEDELQHKVSADYWQPQMEALQRADAKFDAKLSSMEKDMYARFSHESAQRDGVKNQLQDSLKTCMDKISSIRPKERFVEVGSAGNDEGLVTPRYSFGSPVSTMGKVTLGPMTSTAGSAMQMVQSQPVGNQTVLPIRSGGTPGMPTDKNHVIRQISLTGGATSPGHRVVASSPMYRSTSPQQAPMVRGPATMSPRPM